MVNKRAYGTPLVQSLPMSVDATLHCRGHASNLAQARWRCHRQSPHSTSSGQHCSSGDCQLRPRHDRKGKMRPLRRLSSTRISSATSRSGAAMGELAHGPVRCGQAGRRDENYQDECYLTDKWQPDATLNLSPGDTACKIEN